MYIISCWYCGASDMKEYSPSENIRFFHEDCREEYEKEKKETLDEYVQLKIKVMHERSLRLLEKQGAVMTDYYDESIAVLEKALEEPGKFASSHEMMTAMELLRNGVRFKPEYTIGRRRVDFLIPEMKVVLEIDGHLHEYKQVADSERDIEILGYLNSEDNGWEVIRIPTKRIEQNIKKLLPAIKALYKHKQYERKKNGGFLPHGNTLRQDEHYQKILQM